MKKPKVLTPDVLLKLLMSANPVFKIGAEGEVNVKQEGAFSIWVTLDGEDYLVNTFRELDICMTILNDMFDQLGKNMQAGTTRQEFVKRNIETGEETILDELPFDTDEEEEDDEPKILS